MSRILWCLALILATAVHAAAPAPAIPSLQVLPQQPMAAHMAAELISRYHYHQVAYDEDFSRKVFDHYLKSLDGDRVFFVQSDIDQWSDVRTKLGDAITKEDLTVPFAVFNRYLQRVGERFAFARSLLKGGFDFSKAESYRYAREDDPWPKSDAEANEIWRKRVKNDWLQLKLSGKAEKSIAETLDKRYENSLKRIARMKSEDAFQIFMNAYTMAVEPHTSYMGPRATEDFDISMRLSLVGIGAVLEEKDDYATIKELVPGSPAALSGRLSIGDRIAAVGQGESAAVDVVGWRLDDTVALIRGKADTVVKLDILPAGAAPDAKLRTVALVRKKVSLEAQAAKKSILTVGEGAGARRIGVVTLQGFYEDFEARRRGEPDYRSATRDVARLLSELKAEKVDGVVMDLRNNGGGSLTEAIDLTGLFIDTGPVVQQRDARGRVNVAADTNAGVAWDGPLSVLINRASASASEIFAAAIQDYGRGIVVGENSFGKGTVQSLVNLDELTGKKNAQLGELRLTIAQFFRINGSTTQLRGVEPDIRLPSFFDPSKFGESSYDNALPWIRIRPADYDTLDNFSDVVPQLRQRHDARVANDPDYKALVEDVTEAEGLRKRKEISLNEAERKKEKATRDARVKARKKAGGDAKAAAPEHAANGDDTADADEDADKPKKDAKDVVLTEAVAILGDAAELFKNRPRLAGQPGARTPAK